MALINSNLKRAKSPVTVRFSRLSAKIAFSMLVATLFVSALVYFLIPAYPWWGHVIIPILLSLFAYGIARRLLAGRLLLAGTILKQVRKHQFDNLENAHLPRGDELNGLIWQVYRTGRAMEKEFLELRKIEDYRREFLGNVSHELKTPIFTIQGFAETLLDGALEDERVNQEFVSKILNNSKRLRNLANDLVEISRIETGELVMVIAPFHLSELIREVVEGLEQVAETKAVTLSQQVPEELPLILGDREKISQVMVNLIDNAIKYSNENGSVEIVGRVLSTGEVKVTVADNGIGIAYKHIARLTERFYRVDKSRSRAQGGTGLGLAIVKHILAAHNSEMVIESKPGSGSTFGFKLETVD